MQNETENLTVFKSVVWLHLTSITWHLQPLVPKVGLEELKNTQNV